MNGYAGFSLNDPNQLTQMTGLGNMSGWDFNLGGDAKSSNVGGSSFGRQTPGSNTGFGLNLDTGKLVLGGLQSLGGLWNAFEQNKLAKKQLAFSRDFANINLGNQTQAYNTNLADMARARGFTEGQTQQQIDNYVAANRLPDRRV